MANGNSVPEKVAWILIRDDRVLVTRSHGRDRFYFPGGHREPGESDDETLVREIDEELQAAIDPGSMVHFGTFEIGEGHPDHGPFRMICYTADHHGELTPSREIAEKAWFRYADRYRVSAVDEMAFDALHRAGLPPDPMPAASTAAAAIFFHGASEQWVPGCSHPVCHRPRQSRAAATRA